MDVTSLLRNYANRLEYILLSSRPIEIRKSTNVNVLCFLRVVLDRLIVLIYWREHASAINTVRSESVSRGKYDFGRIVLDRIAIGR